MKRKKLTIQNNEQVGNLDTVKQGGIVETFQVKRPKTKCVLGSVKSIDTTLDENNYVSYNPKILKKVLKSETDKVVYQQTATTNSTGRMNAENVMPVTPGP